MALSVLLILGIYLVRISQHDIKYREISNCAPVAVILASPLLSELPLAERMIGLVGVFVPLLILNLLLGIGMGDVKLAAAFGFVIGIAYEYIAIVFTLISAFEVSDLCNIIEEANMDGAVKIDIQRTSDKLSILLETAGSDVWSDVFKITEDLEKYVTETQLAIELALDEAGIPVDERTLSLDNMVQAALFVYFEGFFQLPVSGSELASGTNGILSQFGEASSLHEYNYGSVANDYGAAERGITLQLENAETAIHADLLHCDDTVITMAYIYDVWDADEHELDRKHMPSAIENPANKIYNRSAVTIAYIIDTMRFEEVYGFPFPRINSFAPDGGYVTLLLEFTCLDSLNEITEYDKGRTLEDIFGTRDDVIIGYCHDGYYDREYDWKGDSMAYYHNLASDECVPHIGIKTYFIAGASEPERAEDRSSTYSGPTMMSENSTTILKVNPRLWFKGFRTTMSDELLATLDAATP